MTTTDTLELTAEQMKAVAIRSMQIMATGTRDEFDEVVHPDAVNRESKDEPPETRGRGPAAFYATALWLRGWFDDLAFEVHDLVVDGDLVVVHNTMSGRHTGTAVMYGVDGGVEQAMPPTRRTFATTQSHWLRVRDGKVVEHWANRDDQGTAMQLGWIPPSRGTSSKWPWPPVGPGVVRPPGRPTPEHTITPRGVSPDV